MAGGIGHDLARWGRSRRDYGACQPIWVSTPGGRALHAMMDGDVVPLCGVQPVPPRRAHRWREGHRWGVSHRHKRCVDLAYRETARRVQALIERQRAEMMEGSNG